jgi:hypothetical protein
MSKCKYGLGKAVGLSCMQLSERGRKLQVRLCKLDNYIGGFSISNRTHRLEACSLRLEALPIQIPKHDQSNRLN